MTNWKAVLGVLGIFILGFFGGVAVTSIIAHHIARSVSQHPLETTIDALERRLTRNLDLDPSQREKIHESFQEYLDARRSIQMDVRPKVQGANRALLQEVTAVLHPDQQEKFSVSLEDIRTRVGKGVLETGAAPGNGALPPPNPPPNNGPVVPPPH